MPTLWIASSNAKKRAELERLLEPLGYALRSQSEAPEAVDVVEDAPDFAGNAAKKATTLARLVGQPALGDDSGLCVDALDGRPGVHSARYAGPGATDAQRNAKLLAELADVTPAQRTARFVCHICLADGDGQVLAHFEETCDGTILESPSGSGGFGYDPLFVPSADIEPSADRSGGSAATFAQLSPQQKSVISHRGKALTSLLSHLEQHPLD